MGDIVHALPVLASVRAEWPGAEVDWLVERKHAALLELVEGLSSRFVIDTRDVLGSLGWRGILRQLRARRHDLVLDVQGLIKSALLARGTGAPRVLGFARGHAREAAAAWAYTTPVDPSPAQHVVDRNLAVARAAGLSQLRREFPLAVPMPGGAVARALDALGARYAVMNPGAAWPNKRWPADRFGALAARVHARHGLVSLVLWGPGEEALADEVVCVAGAAAVRAPRTTLHDLVAVLARASLVVAGDTGPMHLAAALGRPVVGLFGPTDPQRNGPWGSGDTWVSRSDRCECSHKRQCLARQWCLGDVRVDEVEEAVNRRLASADAAAVAAGDH
jgi:lipopolysaccharide heptosyltransferase I